KQAEPPNTITILLSFPLARAPDVPSPTQTCLNLRSNDSPTLRCGLVRFCASLLSTQASPTPAIEFPPSARRVLHHEEHLAHPPEVAFVRPFRPDFATRLAFV